MCRTDSCSSVNSPEGEVPQSSKIPLDRIERDMKRRAAMEASVYDLHPGNRIMQKGDYDKVRLTSSRTHGKMKQVEASRGCGSKYT